MILVVFFIYRLLFTYLCVRSQPERGLKWSLHNGVHKRGGETTLHLLSFSFFFFFLSLPLLRHRMEANDKHQIPFTESDDGHDKEAQLYPSPPTTFYNRLYRYLPHYHLQIEPGMFLLHSNFYSQSSRCGTDQRAAQLL